MNQKAAEFKEWYGERTGHSAPLQLAYKAIVELEKDLKKSQKRKDMTSALLAADVRWGEAAEYLGISMPQMSRIVNGQEPMPEDLEVKFWEKYSPNPESQLTQILVNMYQEDSTETMTLLLSLFLSLMEREMDDQGLNINNGITITSPNDELAVTIGKIQEHQALSSALYSLKNDGDNKDENIQLVIDQMHFIENNYLGE